MSTDQSLPPGTVLLSRENLANDASTLILEPQPTSDPNDPLNWTEKRKWVNFVLTLTVTAVIFTALSIQGIFWQLMVIDMPVTYGQLINSYAIGLCGTATGCIFFIPLAIKYGRRPVYIVSTAIMLAMNIWTSKMQTVGEIYATNILAGFAGGTNETIVQMTIADLWFVHQRGNANGLYMMMVTIGSFLSPIGAGYMATAYGWRFCYNVLTGFMGAIFLAFILFYEETKYTPMTQGVASTYTTAVMTPVSSTDPLKKITTNSPDNKDNDSNDTEEVHTSNTLNHEIDRTIPMNTWSQRLRLITKTDDDLITLAYRPFIVLFSFPAVMYTALQYSFGLSWIGIISNTISFAMPKPPYNFNPSGIGLMSLGPFIGSILGSIYGGVLGDKIIVRLAKRNGGYYEPEMRLQLQHLPALLMPAGILIFGLTVARGLHWIYPSIGGALFGFGLGSICDGALTLVIDSYKDITGEAFVGIAFIRNLFSIVLTFAYTPWVKAQGLQNMYIVDGIWAFAIALLHIPLIIWGKRIRQKTARRYHEFVVEKGSFRG